MNPKCARLQRLRRAAGCFGEKAATPNPGRGLRFPASRAANRNSPHPHQNAADKNRGLTAYNKTAGPVPRSTSPAIVIVSLGSFAPAGATRACAALDLRPGSPGGHNLWDRPLRLPAGSRHILGPPAQPLNHHRPGRPVTQPPAPSAPRPHQPIAAAQQPHGQPPKAALRPCLP